jgi:DnaJ domain
MVDTFEYRPRFVDIRVNKPETVDRASHERACDQIGCRGAGLHKAPKHRGAEPDYWWFCANHASDYNRRWNYFNGMTDDELRDYEAAERTGHRPTWTFRAARGDRISAARNSFERGRRVDPFNLFRDGRAAEKARGPRARPLGRLQLMALETLDLDERADGAAIRTRYAELVKRFHPDSNGGDRTAEAHLHKVIRAYQTLKSARLA